MPIANPQALIKICSQLLPAAATEPNIGKELEMIIDRALDLSGMTVAYCVEAIASTLVAGQCVFSLDLMNGDLTLSQGTGIAVRSGKDAFGNDLPSNMALIGLILLEADSANVANVACAGSGDTLVQVGVAPGKCIVASHEVADANTLSITFTTIGDSIKVTVFAAP